MPLDPGTRLGPYEIVSSLGAGGMGEVYLGRDLRLERNVAIKVSREQFGERFEREAHAIAALNHPHVCILYDVGPDYLVMELVEGETLADRTARGPLPVADLLPIARQMTEALQAAHAKGIVHRDLKPANVKVTPEGSVKVLDFGLATPAHSAVGPADDTRTVERGATSVGTILGTAAYMSPEQARGERVDARSDLFALGAVFYEMATAGRAFPRTLDWSAPPTESLPAPLKRIVLKLLQADRERRYQSASEVLADLESWQRSRDDRQTLRRWWMLAATLLVLLAVASWAALRSRPGGPAPRDQWVKLTNFPDSVSQPALSPDGRLLTFVRGDDTFLAPGQIYVKQLPDGDPVQLTHDDLTKMSPAFSPDGSRIAYTVGGWHTWIVSLVSGQPRPWLTNASGLVWLDKESLMFSEVRKDEDIHMGIVTSGEARAGARELYLPKSLRGMAHRSYRSPDGKSVLIVEMIGSWLPCRLVPMQGDSIGRPVGPPDGRCTFAAWSPDGKWMYFTSSTNDAFHVWRQRYPDGQLEQLTSGPTEEEGIALAPDGRSFVTSVALRQSVVMLHDGRGERQISQEGFSCDPKFSPDGRYLAYRVLNGGQLTSDPSDLHLVELATGHNETLLTGVVNPGPSGLAYQFSQDGRRVVATVRDGEGRPRLWVAAIDRQSPPRQIPNVEGDDAFFGKGAEVFFRRSEGAVRYAYRVLEDGTGLRRLIEQPIVLLTGVSTDGQWVIAKVPFVTVALPAAGGPAMTVVQSSSSIRLTWSSDGTLLYVAEPAGGTATRTQGRTYVIPLPPRRTFPPIPDGGFELTSALAALPGARVIDTYDVGPGPSPDAYAFSRASVQRNLYRIPLP